MSVAGKECAVRSETMLIQIYVHVRLVGRRSDAAKYAYELSGHSHAVFNIYYGGYIISFVGKWHSLEANVKKRVHQIIDHTSLFP